MELIHFADVHIGVTANGRQDPGTGVNTRVLDYLESMDVMTDYIEDRKPDLVLFAGDAYHMNHPSPLYTAEFGLRIREISELCPIVLIPGNHDLVISKKVSTIDVFGVMKGKNIFVADAPKGLVVETTSGPIYVACMPYPARGMLVRYDVPHEEYMQVFLTHIERLQQEAPTGMPKILLGHFTIAGCEFGSEKGIALGKDADIFPDMIGDWDYVALGHIHKHQNLGTTFPIVYAGSLDRIDFGEEKERKGFVHVTLGEQATFKFVNVGAREMRTLQYTVDTKSYHLLKRKISKDVQGLQDTIVRVVVNVIGKLDIDEVELLDIVSTHAFHVSSMSIKQQHNKAIRLATEEDIHTFPMKDLLVLYLQEDGHSSKEIEELVVLFDLVEEDVKEGVK